MAYYGWMLQAIDEALKFSSQPSLFMMKITFKNCPRVYYTTMLEFCVAVFWQQIFLELAHTPHTKKKIRKNSFVIILLAGCVINAQFMDLRFLFEICCWLSSNSLDTCNDSYSKKGRKQCLLESSIAPLEAGSNAFQKDNNSFWPRLKPWKRNLRIYSGH